MRQMTLGEWTEGAQGSGETRAARPTKGTHAAARRAKSRSRSISGTASSDGSPSQSYESEAESIAVSEAERVAAEYENRQIAEEVDEQLQQVLLREAQDEAQRQLERRQEQPAAARETGEGTEAWRGRESGVEGAQHLAPQHTEDAAEQQEEQDGHEPVPPSRLWRFHRARQRQEGKRRSGIRPQLQEAQQESQTALEI